MTLDNVGDGVAMLDRTLRLATWNSNFQRILKFPIHSSSKARHMPTSCFILARRGEFGADADPQGELRRLPTNSGRRSSFEQGTPTA